MTIRRPSLSSVVLALCAAIAVFSAACETEIDNPTGNDEAPACQVQGGSLDFGRIVADGSFVDRTFTLRNIGGGTLTGAIESDSDAYQVREGSGRFSLGPGQIRRVMVRFQPSAAGEFSEEITVGFRCKAIVLRGSADPPLLCRVDPTSLDFGSVPVGGTAVNRTFTIHNIGVAALQGALTALCDSYSLVPAGGGYTIQPGDSLKVTVRFQPTSAGNQDCLIETGLLACPDVMCTGLAEGAAVCDVSPGSLTFGTVCAGGFEDRTFTISNAGTSPFSGNVMLAGAGFSLASGGGAYTLGPGDSRAVTVRFSPTGGGGFSASIAAGNPACVPVSASGTGLASLPCTVTPATLPFGTVAIGASSVMSYRIDNPGCASITGVVQATCGPFTVISGQGPFTIEPGGFRSVTVRFEPVEPGAAECLLGNGAGCPDVRLTGTAPAPAICSAMPSELDFGSVLVGDTEDRSFTITNIGSGTLSGSVMESCSEVTITAGSGTFNLGAGQQRNVTVRYTPTSVGQPLSCSVDLGTECAAIPLTGVGNGPPQCQVTPTFIQFGAVTINTPSDRTFTIRNIGGGMLTGNVTESCIDYSIPSGGGAFSLGAGESKVVTVRFQPAIFGNQTCGISIGAAGCTSVTCQGSGAQATACQVTPNTLDFDVVTVGSFAERTFNISNVGGGTITGAVSLGSCPGYTIVSGGEPYSLSGGQTRMVRVRFTATVAGMFDCDIETGSNDCQDVSATAEAQNPPACLLDPTSLSFDTVTIGSFVDKSFTITNTGGGSLTGNVTETCPDFLFTSGGGAFNLGQGQSRTVVVRFSPQSTGLKSCSIATGSQLCPTLSATGTGEAAPFCSISGTLLSFGSVPVGSFADQSFTITNTGGGLVTGSVSELCDAFTIQSGSGVYSLSNGQSRMVTVRFSPTTGGSQSCLIETGSTSCGDVSANGTGDPPPVCSVSPPNLSFGNVSLNTPVDRSFTITNTGGQTLTGSVSESCAEFTIQSGAGAFSLGANQSKQITVRLMPTSVGAKSCTIETGGICEDVPATGTGEIGPVCSLSTSTLTFGLVAAGLSSDRSFTITNTGGGTLSGTVSEACAQYSIVSGGGSYNLTAGQMRTVTVRFSPADFTTQNCTIVAGGICGNVSASGTGGVSHARHIVPNVNNNCALSGCHTGGNPLPDFRVYATMSNPSIISLGNPPNSLIFRKASIDPGDFHGGGKPWPVGSAPYNTVLTWIQQGAPNLP